MGVARFGNQARHVVRCLEWALSPARTTQRRGEVLGEEPDPGVELPASRGGAGSGSSGCPATERSGGWAALCAAGEDPGAARRPHTATPQPRAPRGRARGR